MHPSSKPIPLAAALACCLAAGTAAEAQVTDDAFDVAQGTILGQHALALCVVVFVTVRFHLLMRVFPMQQLTATIFALLALYQFVLFWINGVAGINVATLYYWAPVLTGTALWPVVTMLLSGIRMRSHSGR